MRGIVPLDGTENTSRRHFRDLLAGRVQRRDERKEATQARKQKPPAKPIERPIIVLAGPREKPSKPPRR